MDRTLKLMDMLKENLFKTLVRKHKVSVFKFARYLLSDTLDAEDATLEVMLKLWSNIGTINPLAYKSWLMKTTYNMCVDFRRKKKIEILTDHTTEGDLENFTDEEDNSPAATGENNELGTIISHKISLLPEQQRSVFVLYQIEGFKYREISKITGIPLNSVKVNLLRARKKLQLLLKDYYEGRQAI